MSLLLGRARPQRAHLWGDNRMNTTAGGVGGGRGQRGDSTGMCLELQQEINPLQRPQTATVVAVTTKGKGPATGEGCSKHNPGTFGLISSPACPENTLDLCRDLPVDSPGHSTVAITHLSMENHRALFNTGHQTPPCESSSSLTEVLKHTQSSQCF